MRIPTLFDRVGPAGPAPVGWQAWLARLRPYAIWCFAGDTAVALILTATTPLSGGFWDNFVYSQCIGFSIMGLIVGPQIALHRHSPLPAWAHLLIVVAATVAGFLGGSYLAATMLGHPPFFLAGQQRESLLVPVLITTALASIAGNAFFWTRERMANLGLQAEIERARAQAASRQAADAQLRMLRAQLEPHMLFNTLANLRVLMGQDPQAAQQMLDRLIGFLRATLTASRSDRVTLEAEFALLADYLELIAIRLGPRLAYRLDLPSPLVGARVLPMLLQPLVENAVRHGIEPRIDGGRLDVRAERIGTMLRLSVTDTGDGIPAHRLARAVGGMPEAEGGGFGLSQIRERLHTAYGPQAAFRVLSPRPDGSPGTRIEIDLPLEASPT
jgi:sensor histidine kinase YesM